LGISSLTATLTTGNIGQFTLEYSLVPRMCASGSDLLAHRLGPKPVKSSEHSHVAPASLQQSGRRLVGPIADWKRPAKRKTYSHFYTSSAAGHDMGPFRQDREFRHGGRGRSSHEAMNLNLIACRSPANSASGVTSQHESMLPWTISQRFAPSRCWSLTHTSGPMAVTDHVPKAHCKLGCRKRVP
jgi:hypothetical protein